MKIFEKNNDKSPKNQKFFVTSRRKVPYSHKWSNSPNGKVGESEEKEKLQTKSLPSQVNIQSRLQKVKQPQQCMESGELNDFKQELEYILSTLLSEDSAQNLKHLSAIQLAKKCTSAEFRRFLRMQNVLNKIFTALSDLQDTPALALTSSVIIYFFARDQKSIPITDVSVRLISDLLKQEQNRSCSDAEFKKHSTQIWSIIKEWLNKCLERTSKTVHIGLTEDTLSASFLMLEALAYVSIREHNDFFKSELLNSGCLQWVVAKLDKAVLKLFYTSGNIFGTVIKTILEEIERCFRILENAAAFNKKNQVYLINHRNSLLLESGTKFLNYFKDFADKYEVESCASDKIIASNKNFVLVQMLDCVCLLSRVFMNVSHENEVCSKKLGQKEGFLKNCLHILTHVAPRIVPKEKLFDLCVMMYGLLVNLVERCNANRQKILEFNVQVYDADSKITTTIPVLEALAKLFVKHDVTAKSLDEELDNDIFEEPIEDEEASSQPANSQSDSDNRLHRPVELSEDEMLNAVQSVMNKASAHMEDSMAASYLSLFFGCLLQSDQTLADEVKQWLPNKNLSSMIDQLQRFFEFMKLTKMKEGATRSIERIIQSMELLT